MAAIMKLYGVLLIQALLSSNVFAQYRVQNLSCEPHIQNPFYSQPKPPLINSLLSTYASNMPLLDKLNTIAAVIQKLPPKNPGMTQKRFYVAEALKKTALESLMYAANACKCSQKAVGRFSLPNPEMTFENDVLPNRVVNVRYDRYV